VAYGYRQDEVGLTADKLNAPKECTEIDRLVGSPADRKPVSVSLGPHVASYAMPKPDLDDTATLLAGVIKRAASCHPPAEKTIEEEFDEFVTDWIETNLRPIAPTADTSVDQWLKNTHYPEWRKEELREKYRKHQESGRSEFHPRYKRAKCFVKDETYPEFKHARGIYSRSDEYKCFVGPIFKLIEEIVYENPAFIKHVPVKDRPQYIIDLFEGIAGTVKTTDFTAFESQFRERLMKMAEIKLYKYMVQHLPNRRQFEKHLQAIYGEQYCVFRRMTVRIPTCRLSGDMCTSLGNGFTNLMIILFFCKKIAGASFVKAVVEGDDGLFKHDGKSLSAEDFARLGLTIKIEEHDKVEHASFCGMVFDIEDRAVLADPAKLIANFGWGDRKYTRAGGALKKRLLRAKALSLAWQYNGCPVVTALAEYGLRMTRGVNLGSVAERSNSYWHSQILRDATRDERSIRLRAPGFNSRIVVEEKFGITVQQQLQLEAYFSSKNDLKPFSHPVFDEIFARPAAAFSLAYVQCVSVKNLDLVHFQPTTIKNRVRQILKWFPDLFSPTGVFIERAL